MHIGARRLGAVAIVAVVAALLAGGASAFWRVLGVGSSSGQAATASALTLSPAATTGPLYPGRTADVAVAIVNANPSRTFVGSLLLDASQATNGFAVDVAHAGCNLAALGYATQTNGGSGWSVAANSTLSVDLAGAVSLSTAALSGCQGAQVLVYLRVGA